MKVKITYKNKKPDQVNFRDIEVGQTFFDRDGEICIKVRNALDAWNVVSFSNNVLYEFMGNRLVTPVNAELIVHAEER